MIVETITTTRTTGIAAPAVESRQLAAQSSQGRSGPSLENPEDVELLQDVLEVAQNHFHISDVGLNFSVHGDTGRIKVSVMDKETGELIREIPPEQVLNLMAKIDEMLGILYDAKA